MNKWITSTKKKINELNKVYGPVNAKAFPGRAAILIKLLNLNTNNIRLFMKLKVQEKFIITFLEQEYQFCLKKNYINKIQINQF